MLYQQDKKGDYYVMLLSLFVQYYETFCAAYKRGLEKSKAAGELGDIDTEVLAYTCLLYTSRCV